MVRFLRFAILGMILLPAAGVAQTVSKQCSNAPVMALASQPGVSTDNSPVVEPYDGTYRFIFTKGVKQAFTTQIFDVINGHRMENEEVVIALSEYCKVQILSRRQVAAPGFVPFTQSFIFE